MSDRGDIQGGRSDRGDTDGSDMGGMAGMGNGDEERLRLGQAAFQGRMIASATHEFQNHFAVIKEYNGLAGDLLSARKPDKKTVRRCADITGSVMKRAILAGEMAECLNRFAHRSDTARSRFEPAAIVEDMVILLRRTADRRRVDLTAERQGTPSAVINDASLFQFLIYLLAVPRLDGLQEEGSLTLGTAAAGDDGALVVITAAGRARAHDGSGPPAEDHELIDICSRRLSCRLEPRITTGTIPGTVTVLLPSLKASRA